MDVHRRRMTNATQLPEVRGLGGFVRSSWDEVNEIIAAANVYTIKSIRPDRVIGFSPIPGDVDGELRRAAAAI